MEVWGRYWHDRNGDDVNEIAHLYHNKGIDVLFLFDEDFADGSFQKKVVEYAKSKS